MKPTIPTPELQELERSKKILQNLERIVKTSTFSGSEALNVADGILLIRHLLGNCEISIKAAKSKQPEVAFVDDASEKIADETAVANG